MKTLSRHLAETFTSQYRTRVEPKADGRLEVHVGYPINGTHATRIVAGHQVQNTLLVETILEDMRNELARPQYPPLSAPRAVRYARAAHPADFPPGSTLHATPSGCR